MACTGTTRPFFSFATAPIYAQAAGFFGLVKIGTPQSIQSAIDQGADISARAKNGVTVLMTAVESNNNPDVITLLLDALTTRSEKVTPKLTP